MLNINKVILAGRLTKDIELRQMGGSGKYVTNFTVAVNRSYKTENGESIADFINCVAYNQSADYLSRYAKKGDLLGVDGEVQTRKYKNSNDQTVYVTEIRVNRVCIESKKAASAVEQVQEEQAAQDISLNDDSFMDTQNLEISGEDLPFY